jgi:hypothetical protein
MLYSKRATVQRGHTDVERGQKIFFFGKRCCLQNIIHCRLITNISLRFFNTFHIPYSKQHLSPSLSNKTSLADVTDRSNSTHQGAGRDEDSRLDSALPCPPFDQGPLRGEKFQ